MRFLRGGCSMPMLYMFWLKGVEPARICQSWKECLSLTYCIVMNVANRATLPVQPNSKVSKLEEVGCPFHHTRRGAC